MSVRVLPADSDPWPGPLWEPTVHDGKYPFFAQPGDIYINRYPEKEKPPKPALYYLFTDSDHCIQISREEMKAWVTGGLMKSPTPAHTNEPHGPSSSKRPETWQQPLE